LSKSRRFRSPRDETEKFKRFPLETFPARDKVNLNIFWVKDHALDDPDLLPPPDEVAAEIVQSLEAALDRFRNVANALGGGRFERNASACSISCLRP